MDHGHKAVTQKAAVFVLGSPVPGYIWPHGVFHLPAFTESRTLAGHIAAHTALGCDFSNGRTGDPVTAMVAGEVYQLYVQHTPGELGDGALIVRVRQAGGRNQGYAHLLNFAPGLKVGHSVARGQLLGHVGKSGVSTAQEHPEHLHCHDQDAAGNHHEVYAELEQNHSIQFNANASGVNIRLAPGLAGSIWAVARTAGIYVGGTRIGGHDDLLSPREAAQVTKDGYQWLPRRIANHDVWVARPFVHFV